MLELPNDLKRLELGTRAWNVLLAWITYYDDKYPFGPAPQTIAELDAKTDAELLRIPNCGKLTVADIRIALREWRNHPPPTKDYPHGI